MNSRSSKSASDWAGEPLTPDPEDDDLSSYVHRQFIGYLGFVLPILLFIVAGLRPTEGLPQWESLGSISAYYYTGGVAIFTGVLIVLAVYLFTYQGYKNEYRLIDRLAAIIAGIAAVLVAFFPTKAPNNLPKLDWWTKLSGDIHNLAAAVLFLAFIIFSLFLFTKSKVEKGKPLPKDKQIRNLIYILCGVAMAVCMLWAGISLKNSASIFWPETLALEFFAVSWLVKGRADRTSVVAGKRIIHYGRNPGQLVDIVKSSIRG